MEFVRKSHRPRAVSIQTVWDFGLQQVTVIRHLLHTGSFTQNFVIKNIEFDCEKKRISKLHHIEVVMRYTISHIDGHKCDFQI